MLEIGKQLQGFKITNKNDLGKKGCLWEMEHIKTAARLAWLDNGVENKVFSITFRTTPEDGTGVFHILEHSVLNGSESFPTKKLFVELMKGSLNTYLNASTSPDKTNYPVASRNEKDFFNLARVYLDCTLFPMVLTEKRIFEQEKNVVYNEMKGIFSSPEERLGGGLSELLFPDTYLGCESGGDPAEIPNLTYEQLKSMHQKYYHPTNSYVYLDGDMDIEKMLFLIDSYFSRFEKGELAEYVDQKAVAPASKTDYYLSFDEYDMARFACGKILEKKYSREDYLAFNVLSELLNGTNESPLKKAVLESGIAFDLEFYVVSNVAQPYLYAALIQMDPERRAEAVDLINKTISDIVEDGIKQEELYAEIDQLEYFWKDEAEPAGLMRSGMVIDGWIYNGNPASIMNVEADLAALRDFVKKGRYEELLKDLILEDYSEYILLPGAEFDDEEDEINEELLAWQNEEEDPEILTRIPRVEVSDIKESISYLDTYHLVKNNSEVLFHEAKGTDINHYSLYFSLADCTVEEMQVLSFMTNLFNCLPTENFTLLSLEKEMKRGIGEVDYNVIAYMQGNVNECRPMFHVSFSTLATREETAFDLIAEIIRRTDFVAPGNEELIYQILMQGREDLFQSIIQEGSRYSSLRASSHLQAAAALMEKTEGYTFYEYISEIADDFELRISDFMEQMNAVSKKVFTASRMTVSITADELGNRADKLTALFVTDNEVIPKSNIITFIPDGKCDLDHIEVPSTVSFAASSGLLPDLCEDYCGQYEVLANVMDLGYLWTKIRVQGGAYGCGSFVSRNGVYGFSSFRDPNPETSLEAFEGCYKGENFIPESIDNYIIGAYAANTPLLDSRRLAAIADSDYFIGLTKEDRLKTLDEILSTSVDSLKELAKKLEPVEGKYASCIIGA